jgi:hypothetical protein
MLKMSLSTLDPYVAPRLIGDACVCMERNVRKADARKSSRAKPKKPGAP